MRQMTSVKAIATSFFGLLAAGAAQAQVSVDGLSSIGKPEDRLMGWQPAVTELAEDIHWLDGMLLVIITAISLFVVMLLAIVALRYNSRSNPTPAKFTHNTPIEVTWTIVPIIILVFIGAFSLPVLFKQQEIPEGDITIKVTGYQWYWGYEYVDAGVEGAEPSAIRFDSYMVGHPATLTPEDDAAGAVPYVYNAAMGDVLERFGYASDEFLLATDQAVVIPTGKKVVMQVTAADVIHSWTIPAFGVKQDGVPGRLAELWFEVDEGKEGIYFGQCSELCGKDHAYMPITVKAVTQEQYEDWLNRASLEYAGKPLDITVAVAE